ncbi:MAG TPA: DUF6173 family protein [Cytophagaceae bacterium]
MDSLNFGALMKAIQNTTEAAQRLKWVPPEIPEIRNYSLADYQYEIIREAIIEFEKSLDQEHEVAIKLAAFGQTILMNITDIGYSNPCLIHFYGTVNGNEAELIQHVSQLNFLLMAVPKAEPEKPPRRIGFRLEPAQPENSVQEE